MIAARYSQIESLINDPDLELRQIKSLFLEFNDEDEPLLQNSPVIDLIFLKAFPNLTRFGITGTFGRTIRLSLEGIEHCYLLKFLTIGTKMVEIASLNGLEYCTDLVELDVRLDNPHIIDISAILDLTNLQVLGFDERLSLQPPVTRLGMARFSRLTSLQLACDEKITDLSFLQGIKLEYLSFSGPLESIEGLDMERLRDVFIRNHKRLSVKPFLEGRNLKRICMDWSLVIDKHVLNPMLKNRQRNQECQDLVGECTNQFS